MNVCNSPLKNKGNTYVTRVCDLKVKTNPDQLPRIQGYHFVDLELECRNYKEKNLHNSIVKDMRNCSFLLHTVRAKFSSLYIKNKKSDYLR